jgi:hypothetical protein
VTHIFRWDLDKTYLRTDFDTLADLVKTALQSAEEKTNIPGTATLMRELRVGPDGRRTRTHIVSGSPRQLRRVLLRKLQLDGAEIDSLTLKPNLGNILRFRFRALRDQLGYKLPTLLESRTRSEPSAKETCFGDDAEMDGIVYRLYSDICGGRLRGGELDRVLTAARLYPDQELRIRRAANELPEFDPVERILIHLETGSPTNRFTPLGARVVPTFNTFQSALILFIDGRLSADSVGRISQSMIDVYGYDGERLQHSLEDLVRRGRVSPSEVQPICERQGLRVPTEYRRRQGSPQAVDYVALLEEVHEWQQARKAARKLGRKSLSRILKLD